MNVASLLDSDGLGQVAGKVDIETLENGQPVGNELQGDDVEEALKTVHCLGDLNLLRIRSLELWVIRVANDNGLATTGNN